MISLRDLLVLNSEISALVRAGIPLELGLRQLSRTVSGQLGQLAERLAVRMESGQTLADAMRVEGAAVSPLYVAVMESAIKTQDFAAALDGLVLFGRTLQDLRRQVLLALIYPTIVAVMAYTMLVIFAVMVFPSTLESWDEQSPLRQQLLPIVQTLRATAVWWVPAVPVAVVGGLMVSAWIMRRNSDTQFLEQEPGGSGLIAGTWIPGVNAIYQDLDRAYSVRMLAVLLAQQVSLPQALELASRMTGSRQLAAAYRQLASGLSQGRSLASEVHFETRLPKLIAQLLRAGDHDRELPDALSLAADIYTRRALRRLNWLRSTLSPLFAVVIAGTATFALAVIFGFPLSWLIDELLSQT